MDMPSCTCTCTCTSACPSPFQHSVMAAPNIFSIGSVPDIDDNDVDLSSFKGKYIVVVNVACE